MKPLEEMSARERERVYRSILITLRHCREVVGASTHEELETVVAGDPPIDYGIDLQTQKTYHINLAKEFVMNHYHQAVFRDMQDRIDSLPERVQEMIRLTRALNW